MLILGGVIIYIYIHITKQVFPTNDLGIAHPESRRSLLQSMWKNRWKKWWVFCIEMKMVGETSEIRRDPGKKTKIWWWNHVNCWNKLCRKLVSPVSPVAGTFPMAPWRAVGIGHGYQFDLPSIHQRQKRLHFATCATTQCLIATGDESWTTQVCNLSINLSTRHVVMLVFSVTRYQNLMVVLCCSDPIVFCYFLLGGCSHRMVEVVLEEAFYSRVAKQRNW